MQTRIGASARWSRGLLATPVIAALLLAGCGSSNSANNIAATRPGTTAAETTTTPPSATAAANKKLQTYIKHRFGKEAWYPAIADVEVTEGSVIVGTRLTNTQTSGRNRKVAEVMCRAILKAPQVSSVNVFYDEAGGGSTASC